jgi:ElaA protein
VNARRARHTGRVPHASDAPQVRRASFSELEPATAYRLWALRSAVFVVEQDCAYLDLDGRDLEATTQHLWVEAGGVPVAYARVLDEGDHARIGRVLTAPTHRGQGLAAVLVELAISISEGQEIRLSAQAHLRSWYERFGFSTAGDEFLDDGIPHVPMLRLGSRHPST